MCLAAFCSRYLFFGPSVCSYLLTPASPFPPSREKKRKSAHTEYLIGTVTVVLTDMGHQAIDQISRLYHTYRYLVYNLYKKWNKDNNQNE